MLHYLCWQLLLSLRGENAEDEALELISCVYVASVMHTLLCYNLHILKLMSYFTSYMKCMHVYVVVLQPLCIYKMY